MAYDADSAGRKVGQAILNNSPEDLKEVSDRIQLGNEIIDRWAQKFGGIKYSSGGDQGLYAVPREALEELEQLRKDYEFATNLTVSVGIGSNLSEAGKSLLVAKFRGKNMVVHYDENIEKEVAAAAERAAQGKGSLEEARLAEAYLRPDANENTFNNASQKERAAKYREQDLTPPVIDKPEPTKEDKKQLGVSMEIPEKDRRMNMIAPDPDQNDPQISKPDSKDCLEEQNIPIEQEHYESNEMREDSDNITDNDKKTVIDSNDHEDGPNDSIDDKSIEKELDQHLENEKDMLDTIDNHKQNIPSDMGLSEDDAYPDLSAVLKDGLDAHAENIQREKIVDIVSQALEGFKANKQILERAKDQAPQLYESCLSILKAMIEMAKMLELDESIREEAEGTDQVSHKETTTSDTTESVHDKVAQKDRDAKPKIDELTDQQLGQKIIGQAIGKLPTKQTTPHVARTPYPIGAINEKGQQKVVDPKTGRIRWIDRKKGSVLSGHGIPVRPEDADAT